MIRLGVIGYGLRASTFITGVLRRVSDEPVKVVGIIDPDEKGVRKRLQTEDSDARFYHSVSGLMREARPDAVMVSTRCNLHTPYAVELSHYDVPLFLEKPVAISYEQADTLSHAFESASCPVLVSFPLRVSPLCGIAKKVLDEGAVGRREHILATNYVPYGSAYWETEYRNYQVTGGLFLQKATHDFDYMMELMNSPIVRVAAAEHYGEVFGGDKPADLVCSACDERYTCPESPRNRDKNGVEHVRDHLCVFSAACGMKETGTNEDASSALVEFESGAHGVYTQVFITRRDAARRGAVISGYDGTVDFDWYRNDLKRTRHHEPFSDVITARDGMSHFGGDDALAENLLAMIRSRETPVADIRDGLRSVYVCLAARESAKKGHFVNVRR